LTFIGKFTAWGDGGVAFIDANGAGIVDYAMLPEEILQLAASSQLSTQSQAGAQSAKLTTSDKLKQTAATQLIDRVSVSNCKGREALEAPLTFLRAYSVTLQQFEDIVIQENANTTVTVPQSIIEGLRKQGTGSHQVLLPGRYGAIVYLGEIEGEPLVTFTAPPATFIEWVESSQEKPPSKDYLGVIAAGMVESGWPPAAAAAYLSQKSAPSKRTLQAQQDTTQWEWDE
jgi:hypothetical protein